MSLIRKSDVHNHLSTRSGDTVLPFRPARPEPSVDPETTPAGEKPDEKDISISPSKPISPEAVPNAQVGGSVGGPGSAISPGKRL